MDLVRWGDGLRLGVLPARLIMNALSIFLSFGLSIVPFFVSRFWFAVAFFTSIFCFCCFLSSCYSRFISKSRFVFCFVFGSFTRCVFWVFVSLFFFFFLLFLVSCVFFFVVCFRLNQMSPAACGGRGGEGQAAGYR